ncbi:hypothetical protein TrST_g200 [Triparma strigata]|uniref:Aspartyl/asparaginy/proline hydroxylase domain-containing protein n=1 Tax=Triparma strigata TaxID=1606541 RepID=A0A9W7A4I9_9STRA|nr:hypothetical protein TrST_g200 [Triparma strigata]
MIAPAGALIMLALPLVAVAQLELKVDSSLPLLNLVPSQSPCSSVLNYLENNNLNSNILPQLANYVVQQLSNGQKWYVNTREWSFEDKVSLLTGCPPAGAVQACSPLGSLQTAPLVGELNNMLLNSVKNRDGDLRSYNTKRLSLTNSEEKLAHYSYSVTQVVGPMNRFLINNLILATSATYPSCSESLSQLSLNLSLWSLPSQRPTSVFNPHLRASKFWERGDDEHQVVADIERGLKNLFDDVKQEMGAFFKRGGEVEDEGEGIVVGKWKEITLLKHNVAKTTSFPKTLRHLKNLSDPKLKSPVFNAKISFIYPGTFVEQHTGPSNERLRCHMCLDEGLGGAVLDVAGEEKIWKEGEVFVFDDSFVHSVRYPVEQGGDVCDNDSDSDNRQNDDNDDNDNNNNNMEGVRIVLIVDVWHPEVIERNFV